MQNKQEIWANAYETRDSISLISYAGCLVISAKIFSLNVRRRLKSQNTKTRYFWFQGHSRSSMLVLSERSSAVLVMISSKSVSIFNRSHTRSADSSRNRVFWRGCPTLMPSYGGHIEPMGSKFTLLKLTSNAENFTCSLSWSIFSDFDAVHSWNVYRSLKSQKKFTKTPYYGGSRSFKVIDVNTSGVDIQGE